MHDLSYSEKKRKKKKNLKYIITSFCQNTMKNATLLIFDEKKKTNVVFIWLPKKNVIRIIALVA